MVKGTMGSKTPFFLAQQKEIRLWTGGDQTSAVAFLLVEQPNLFTTNWHFPHNVFFFFVAHGAAQRRH